MELSEVLRRRRMVRSYDPRPVPAAGVDAIVAAALRAPSAGFTQGVSLLLLTESADRDMFWGITASRDSGWLRGMRTAPVLLLVWTNREAYLDRYAEPDKGWTDRDLDHWSAPFWFVDGGMASLAALLAGVDQGLGGCFFGIPGDRIEAVREAFAVPSDQLSVGVISIGYPAPSTSTGSAGRRPRRAAGELLHRHRW